MKAIDDRLACGEVAPPPFSQEDDDVSPSREHDYQLGEKVGELRATVEAQEREQRALLAEIRGLREELRQSVEHAAVERADLRKKIEPLRYLMGGGKVAVIIVGTVGAIIAWAIGLLDKVQGLFR